KVVEEDDPVSLSTEAEPTAQLYLAVARLFEQSGKPVEAQKQYQSALKEDPTNLAALLGYARLTDRMGQPDIALQIYLKAAKSHPNDASVHNNLALLHARQGRLADAMVALQEAIRLQPRVAKYRNNIATILVETGRAEEALSHLRAVHGEPVANYNLGYLLEKQGNTSAALRYFAVALSADPTLTPARQGVDRLARIVSQAPPRVATRPSEPSTIPPTVSAPGIDNRAVSNRFRPSWPPREPSPNATAERPSPVASPNTPPSPPMVHLPVAPRPFAPRPSQVVLPEPSMVTAPPAAAIPPAVATPAPAATPSTVTTPPTVATALPEPRLERAAEPAVGPQMPLPQVHLLPPPPSGYESQRPLPKATGMRPGQMLPGVSIPRRLPPTSPNRPVDSHPSSGTPSPMNAEEGPILHYLPAVR
ncbi:MAG TPA: tetratricopeptide repeat protein, partial [Thermoguttaceae bacterium]|nr:tetratricopeptide repeat protein [Thermoguttaceae bacterium]